MRRTNLAIWCAVGNCLILPLVVCAQVDQDLANLRARSQDPAVTAESRAQASLELASALDRAAQNSTTIEKRRDLWTEAITVLEDFEAKNPGSLRSRDIRFQTALYLWARGEAWAQQADSAPNDQQAREHAIESFDAALTRFRALAKAFGSGDDILAQNIRFRLAQTLADRADFDREGSEERQAKENEAVRLLEHPVTDPALQGFSALLKAQLLARGGKEKEAEQAFQAAEKTASPPSAAEILEARVRAAMDRQHYPQALALIEKSALEPPEKSLYAIRVLLQEREATTEGEERERIESEIFRRYKPLRSSTAPEAKRALFLVSQRIRKPGASQNTEAWSILAEGAAALGDFARAGELEAQAADRTQVAGGPGAAGELRLRAGAYLFQAGKFLEAEALLGRVAEDPLAGAARPKAGLLRALACGRALASKSPGVSAASYPRALEFQVHEFGNDPSANEARWLLGKFRLANSERDAARKLWSAIPRTDAHWMEARLEVATLNQEDLDNQRLNEDRERILSKYQDAKSFLTATLRECRDAGERAAVDLATARLELTPSVGHPDEARALCEGVLRVAGRAEQRDQARRLHIVAVVQQNHFLEAESEAKSETSRSRPSDLLATARLLDLIASESPIDIRVRRVGLILRILLGPVLEHAEELSEVERAEAKIRETRALTLIGDDGRARSSLMNWGTTPATLGDPLLRDLADTYSRLNAYSLAVDVQRLRARRAKVGSLTWFEARYGLALAYYRWGKEEEARKLIDATSILHPDLGGGDLREKYVRLRQRLGARE